MKKLAILALVSLFVLSACQDDNSILSPNNDYASDDLSKGRPILALDTDDLEFTDESDDSDFTEDLDTETKPLSSIKEKVSNYYLDDNKVAEDMNMNMSLNLGLDLGFRLGGTTNILSLITKNYTVDGSKGDKLVISETYLKDGHLISMSAKLTIPKGAFNGKLNFDIIFDFDNYSVELYPSPFTFDKTVLLDLSFHGVDFSKLDTDNLGFNYLDGENEELKYADIRINKTWKYLSIKGAELHHFSRYGWTRTKTTK